MSENTHNINKAMEVEQGQINVPKKTDEEVQSENIVCYPKAKKKVSVHVSPYGAFKEGQKTRLQTNYISPHGLEFTTAKSFDKGSIIKINVVLPDYWVRKQTHVDYGRIDRPKSFRVIGKVIGVRPANEKGRRKNIMVRLLNIDNIDELVLREFIAEG